MKYIKGLLVAFSFQLFTGYTEAQILVTSPMSSPPQAGDYYSPTGITLSPGFSFTAATGQSLRLYISNCVQLNTLPSGNQNYILTSTPRVGGMKDNAGLANRSSCELMQTVQYFDGLGRLVQTVQVKGSPTGRDLVQPVAYDAFGREAQKYLPYTAQLPNSDGSYKTTALTDQSSFYSNPVSQGASGVVTISPVNGVSPAYSQTVFEASPLNRVMEQGAPGGPWQPAADPNQSHTVRMNYSTNDGGNNKVMLYKVAIAADGTRTLTNAGTTAYDAGQLYLTETKDENWQATDGQAGVTQEYKDKEGHVVLKRTFNRRADNSIETLSTYYVYDDLGNLCYVLPPKAMPDGGMIDATTRAQLCYQYRYDERNRLIEKQLPGKGREYMVYNKLDQLVATQDAIQRGKSPQEFTISKYDAMGRVVITGIYQHPSSTAGTDYRAAIQTLVNNQTVFWEQATGASGSYGYTAESWPSLISTFLSVNYYDDYRFAGVNPFPVTGTSASTMTKGLPTGSLTNVLGTTVMLSNVTYYDDEGRVIKSYQQHYLGGTISPYNYDELTSTYNFTGQVTATTRKHYTKNAGNTAAMLAVTVVNSYDYDQMGRKTNTWEQINGGTNVLLAQNTYNEVGQVMTKKLHSADAGNNFLQSIDYAYNERGWLTRINDPNNPPTTAKLFSEQLKYNNTLDPAAAQFNGNIAEQAYRVYNSSPTGIQTVKYTYDKLNRLTDGTNSTGLSETGITYDGVGNILALTRATAPNAASLVYQYTGNQLTTVTKGGAAFRSYGYDANGNATSDGQSNTITYNLLNLPQSIPGKSLTYTYDATGRKLRKVSGSTVTEYINGIQYNGNTIDFIQTEEGRATNSAGTYKYEYTLTDHLGNNRVSFDETNGKVQETDYYPFGLNVNRQTYFANKYLYNKKELQEELTQYDYGARFYDPVIARFTTIDPLATQYPWYAPYQFAGNEVPNAIDRDGLEPAYPRADGTYTIARDGQLQRPLSDAAVKDFKSYYKVAPGVREVDPVSQILLDFLTPILGGLNTLITGENIDGSKATVADKIAAVGIILTSLPMEGGEGGPREFNGQNDTFSGSSKQAFRNAKDQNGIPRSQQPDKVIKPNTPEGNAIGLDKRNVKQYDFTNSKGQKVSIRQDRPASYGQGGKGDQGNHYNAGQNPQQPKDLNQHHNY